MHNPVLNAARAQSAPAAPTREFLALRLGDEDYAIDILKVQEIRVFDAVTKLPGAPKYIKGVINLRGLIAPVIEIAREVGIVTPRIARLVAVVWASQPLGQLPCRMSLVKTDCALHFRPLASTANCSFGRS